jgi:hypothetical protein
VSLVLYAFVTRGREAPSEKFFDGSTSSHPAIVLFDSGASHSFISSAFVAKYHLPMSIMKHTMLVSSSEGEMRTNHICPAVSITIRG